jgi:thioredoxin-dependent peroxiredoxin
MKLLAVGVVLAWALAVVPGDKLQLPKVQDSYGKTVDLKAISQKKKYVVFWFYPKASSPGCSAQGKRYSDLAADFEKASAKVFGVSADPAKEQCSFIEQMALKGSMLPDPKGQLARLFGVGGMFGFYNRDTILVAGGRVEQVWRDVNAFRDADTVLAYIKQQ